MKNLDGFLTWINPKRLRDYPRLMLIVIWLILALNIIFRDGWQGGLGQIIGGDFIVLYSAGTLYREDPSNLYNYEQQALSQQTLVSPTVLPGLNPFISPPYVALAYSLLTPLPLPWAFLLWTISMVACALVSVRLLINILPNNIREKGMSPANFVILVLSFFPFVESLQAGQNSGLTLLLMTCLVYFTLKEKPLLSGIFAGLMIYKPQYIIGFIVLWVIWKNLRSLVGFALVVFIWLGSFYILSGLDTLYTYLGISKLLLLLPYFPGFPGYLLVTLYGLLSTIFSQSVQPYAYSLTQGVMLVGILLLALYAYKFRKSSTIERTPIITLAILLPLLATPYALLHDLVVLIPGFVLWSRYSPRRGLLFVVIIVYLGSFFLTLLSAISHIALNAFIIIGLTIFVIWWLIKGYQPLASSL